MILIKKLDSLSIWPSKRLFLKLLGGTFLLAIIFNVLTANELINSRYPDSSLTGPFPAWWFTFNAIELKSHYTLLIETETLSTFINVQYLDFGLMIFTGAFLFLIAVFIGRLHKNSSFWRRLGFTAAILMVLSSVMDFFENIVLLIMLSMPLTFPDWMAIVYSSLATLKVIFVSVGFIIILFVLFAHIFKKITKS